MKWMALCIWYAIVNVDLFQKLVIDSDALKIKQN